MLPIQLLYATPDGRLELDRKAVQAVLNQPEVKNRFIMPISVVGAFRTGKSLLLNFLLRFLRHNPSADANDDWLEKVKDDRLEGFVSAAGASRVTRGILMWPQVFPVAENLAIILLDTQGTFDSHADMRENTLIVSLSILISSLQIFNLSGQIQLDFLQSLQFFVEYGRHVTSECEAKPFQKLLFLVRDWRHSADNAFGSQGGREYLQSWISDDTRVMNEDKAKICTTLNECFEETCCFLMPYPGDTVAEGVNFRGCIKDVSPKFKRHVKILMDELFGSKYLVGKKVGGSPIEVCDFLEMVETYFEALQSTNDVSSASMFESTARIQHTLAVNRAKSIYEVLMQDQVINGKSVLNLWQLHEEAKQSAIDDFESTKLLGKSSFYLQYRKQLEQDMNDKYESLEKQNTELQKIEKECEDQTRLSEVMDHCLDEYTLTMDNICSTISPVKDLDQVHMNVKEKIMGEFAMVTNRLGESVCLIQSKACLEEELKKRFSKYLDMNNTKLRHQEEQQETKLVEKAVKSSQREYRDLMNNFCAGQRALVDLQKIHCQSLTSSLQRFHNDVNMVKNEKTLRDAEEEIKKEAQELFETFQEINNKKQAAESAFEQEQSLQDAAHRARISLHNELSRICENRAVAKNWQHIANCSKAFSLQVFSSVAVSCKDEKLVKKYETPLIQDLDETLQRYKELNDEKERQQEEDSKSRILRDAVLAAKEMYRALMDEALDSGRFIKNLQEVHVQSKSKALEELVKNTKDIPGEEIDISKVELREYFDTRYNEMETRNTRRKDFEQLEDVSRIGKSASDQAYRVYSRELKNKCRGEAETKNLEQFEQEAREKAMTKFYDIVASRDHELFLPTVSTLNETFDSFYEKCLQDETLKVEQKAKKEEDMKIRKNRIRAISSYKDEMEEALKDVDLHIQVAHERAVKSAINHLEESDFSSQEQLTQEFTGLLKRYTSRRNAQLKEIDDKKRALLVEEATLTAEADYQREMHSRLSRAVHDLDSIHAEVTRNVIGNLRIALENAGATDANARCLRCQNDCYLRLSSWKKKNDDALKEQKQKAVNQLKKCLLDAKSIYDNAMDTNFQTIEACSVTKVEAQDETLRLLNKWKFEEDENLFIELKENHVTELDKYIRERFRKIFLNVSEQILKSACHDAAKKYNSCLQTYLKVSKPKAKQFILWHQAKKTEMTDELRRKIRDCDEFLAEKWVANFIEKLEDVYQQMYNSLATAKKHDDSMRQMFTIGGTLIGLVTGGVAGAAVGGAIGNQIGSALSDNQEEPTDQNTN